MNGVSAHIRALWRERATHAGRHEPLSESARAIESGNRGAEREFERAWIRATLGEACRRVEESLRAAGDGDAWSVFQRHVLDGQSYRAILLAAGEQPTREAEERHAVAVRRGLRLVRAELKAILREDGLRESELDAEVDRMTHLMDNGLDA